MEINQFAEVEVGFEELVKIIKSHLIQDENAQAPIIYDVEYEISGSVTYIYIVKDAIIGEIKGKIYEILAESTLRDMMLEYIKADDYSLVELKYLVEKDDNNKKILTGVRFTYKPNICKSFVRGLLKTDRRKQK